MMSQCLLVESPLKRKTMIQECFNQRCRANKWGKSNNSVQSRKDTVGHIGICFWQTSEHEPRCCFHRTHKLLKMNTVLDFPMKLQVKNQSISNPYLQIIYRGSFFLASICSIRNDIYRRCSKKGSRLGSLVRIYEILSCLWIVALQFDATNTAVFKQGSNERIFWQHLSSMPFEILQSRP